MHGRPRKAPKPEEAAALAAKAEKLRSLQSQFLAFHHDRTYTKEALETSAKLLEINPEYYTAWNYRKLAVEHRVKESESDPDAIKSIYNEELQLIESALRRNFKSYGAWHHRKWVLSKGHSSIDREINLLDQFQREDSRNFHAWNYRRFVTTLLNRSIEEELKYTKKLIDLNFSNYSAWHNRSILLSKLLKQKDQKISSQDVLNEEYNFVRNALFTDPDDQSGWFYHLWLLEQTIQSKAPLLVSTWPASASDIILSGKGRRLSAASGLLSGFPVNLRKFPVVLYFNQNVGGINSSTVTVEAAFLTSKDLTWEPLSPKNSSSAQVWAAYTDLSGMELGSSDLRVQVRLGHCPGIVSSSGLHFCKPVTFEYSIATRSVETESSESNEDEIFSWRDDDMCSLEGRLEETNPFAIYIKSIEDNHEAASSGWHIDTVTEEINHFRDLLAIPDCKIGKLTLARLLMARDAMLSPYVNKLAHCEEVLELYGDLIKLDTPHSQHYKDQSSLVLLKQLLSSKDSLLRHCFCCNVNKSSSSYSPICLRLNNLSLSRVGSFEKLLWVQNLDLSNNELQSIEGLEALQLLSCLNLGNNKLASFSALEALRSLKSLRALNISFNEIGSHTIDTRRYLFKSPLSNSGDISWNRDDDLPDGIGVENYWEAALVFNDLTLVQLDIAGNPVAGEKFCSFLAKISPQLEWLNGQKLH